MIVIINNTDKNNNNNLCNTNNDMSTLSTQSIWNLVEVGAPSIKKK